jgi:NitT/TauT family transport system permease protein
MKSKLISKERKKYLKEKNRKKYLILITQIGILVVFLGIWEILARKEIIDNFITSQPSRIWNTFMNLGSNQLLMHVGVTTYETVVGFFVGTFLGIIIAILLWWSDFLARVADPYLVVLNSLPKVALRTNYYNLGRSWYFSNNCYGSSNIVDCNNIRKLKWIHENRQRSYKDGKNISSK